MQEGACTLVPWQWQLRPTCLKGVAQALRRLHRIDLPPAAHQAAACSRAGQTVLTMKIRAQPLLKLLGDLHKGRHHGKGKHLAVEPHREAKSMQPHAQRSDLEAMDSRGHAIPEENASIGLCHHHLCPCRVQHLWSTSMCEQGSLCSHKTSLYVAAVGGQHKPVYTGRVQMHTSCTWACAPSKGCSTRDQCMHACWPPYREHCQTGYAHLLLPCTQVHAPRKDQAPMIQCMKG